MKTLLHLSAIAGCLLAAPLLTAQDKKPAELTVGEFTFKATAGWTAKETPRTMSKGGFTLAGKDGKTLDADTYYFGEGQGGDVEANVARWKGQFQPGEDGAEVKMERKDMKFGERKATILSVKGTFMSGGPFQPNKTPMPGHAMLGAVLESKTGNVFVKLTGPEKEVEAAREAFVQLISSAYPEAAKDAKPVNGDDKKPADEKPAKKN